MPIARTADGLIRGRVAQAKTPRGGTYLSFQGIRYAQAPTGSLRFQAPKRVEPWVGILDALKEGPVSPAVDFMIRQYAENSDEDCLSLNVFTSHLPGDGDSKKRPVMVWIHGGGFVAGSGNSDLYGPDNLMGRDVVLVTINYRVGVLGFLSLQNEACPGNNGMKDQVEALRWVQRNIAGFGGDPDNVTIFGESAGGAAVQYLMLSPLSKGLFHRAISQSGSVLNPWAHIRNPLDMAFKLGELLGMSTTDKDKLLEYLRIIPPRALVALGRRVMKKANPDAFYLGEMAWSPVVEPALPGAFLTEPVEELVKNGQFHDVPYILGVNTLEGLYMLAKGMERLETKEELERLLPVHPKLQRGTPLADSILQQIKAFYFPNGWDEIQCADILSAQYFTAGIDVALQGLANAPARKSNTYYYVFTYEGFSFLKHAMGLTSWKGTLHGDELAYLFYSHMAAPEIDETSEDGQAIERMCGLWTRFAALGDPTGDPQLWTPYSIPSKPYLEIGNQLTPKTQAYENQMIFWRDIFRQIDESVSAKL